MISLHVLTVELYVVLIVKVFAFERMMPHSNDTELFRSMLDSANHILIITGPGLSLLSPESGISIDPFEKWRGNRIEEINTYDTFVKNPSLVWEYNNYKRNLMFKAIPNQAHVAIANYERYLRNEGKNRKLTVVTQNVDGLHILAGSSDVIEVEGSIFKTRCLLCGEVVENRDNPICPALKGRGSPLEGNYTDIPKQELPRCKRPKCGGLLRPHLVWFGESLDMKEMTKVDTVMKSSDIGLLVGTSARMNPLGMIGPQLAARGVPVGEFSSKPTDVSELLNFHFRGPCTTTLTDMLKI